jgi:hypothetical protein
MGPILLGAVSSVAMAAEMMLVGMTASQAAARTLSAVQLRIAAKPLTVGQPLMSMLVVTDWRQRLVLWVQGSVYWTAMPALVTTPARE